MAQTNTSNTNENIPIEALENSYRINNIKTQENNANNTSLATENAGSILVAIYNNTNAKRENRVAPYDAEQSRQMEYARLQSLSSSESRNKDIPTVRRTAITSRSAGPLPSVQISDRRLHPSHQPSNEENGKMFSSASLSAVQFDNSLSPTNSVAETQQNDSSNGRSSHFPDWTRLYLFGRKRDTEAPRVSRPS